MNGGKSLRSCNRVEWQYASEEFRLRSFMIALFVHALDGGDVLDICVVSFCVNQSNPCHLWAIGRQILPYYIKYSLKFLPVP